MKRIDQLFKVTYGNSFDLASLKTCTINNINSINFVSRTSKNNGVSAVVERMADIPPFPEGTITVAVSGSVLETFIQPKPYYTGYHVLILQPLVEINEIEKLFYCMCIRANKYKYNYGRQANKTLGSILVPEITEIPKNFTNAFLPDYSNISKKIHENLEISLFNSDWKEFRYDEIFKIEKGYYNKKPEKTINGDIPFIGATDSNNGVTGYFSLEDISLYNRDGSTTFDDLSKKIFKKNCITVSNNGSVGFAFYQTKDFTCSHDVNPLYLLNHEMNIYIAMFLITLIEMEKFRWCYGRKWRPKRMPSSKIKLPIDFRGKPDWKFMEEFIKAVPYSSNL